MSETLITKLRNHVRLAASGVALASVVGCSANPYSSEQSVTKFQPLDTAASPNPTSPTYTPHSPESRNTQPFDRVMSDLANRAIAASTEVRSDTHRPSGDSGFYTRGNYGDTTARFSINDPKSKVCYQVTAEHNSLKMFVTPTDVRMLEIKIETDCVGSIQTDTMSSSSPGGRHGVTIYKAANHWSASDDRSVFELGNPAFAQDFVELEHNLAVVTSIAHK